MIYDALSEERKRLQDAGDAPSWWTTGGYQLFKERYQWADTPRKQYETIARTLAKHTGDTSKWEPLFFEMMWNGWLSPSTPVLSNTGTNRGLPVSCSGGVTEDSIEGFYTSRRESAILTKHGFGTSSYLGDIRPRGSEIKSGGKADGVLPVLKGFVQDSRDVRQGSARRGAWAGYLHIDHGDFWEITRFLEKEPDDVNIGWIITDGFIGRLKAGDAEAISRYQEALKVKMVTGKGYFWFVDKANRKLPKYYPIKNKASNLCSEILLPSDQNHTFTCQPDFATLIKRGVGLVTMGEISVGDEVWSESGWTRVTGKVHSGSKPVFEYRTRRGLFVGTEDHRVVQDGEKVEVRFAESIDAISFNAVSSDDKSCLIAEMNGLFLGDGTLRNGKPVLCVGENDEDYYEYFGDHLSKDGYKYFRETDLPLFVDVGLNTYDRDFDLKDCRGVERSFLKGLFSANGSVMNQDGQVRVVLTGTSAKVMTKAMHVLQFLGFTPHLYKSKGRVTEWSNGEYKSKDRYDLMLLKTHEVVRFRDEIGFIQKYKCDVLSNMDEKDSKPKTLTNSVLETTYLGDFDVYHIEVDNPTHTYWTGGLNVSNCVLSSLNLAKYDEWKDTDTIFNATVFLDCVASEFIEKAKGVAGLENAVRFTEKARALGLGVCGWHTFLQQRMIAFESLEAHMWNNLIFKEIHDKSLSATEWMGVTWGPAPWYDEYRRKNGGTGLPRRNCSRIAIAPTKSTALIMGGVSEGINPDPAMVFTQATAGGEVFRVNPVLLELMKEKGAYNKKNVQEINEAFGSVQDVEWLTDDEKKVFRTAFEIDQSTVIRQASSRGKYIDQWQSLNLFFGGTEDPAYVSKVHQEAFLDEGIVGLYYVYSRSEAKGSIDKGECLACQ